MTAHFNPSLFIKYFRFLIREFEQDGYRLMELSHYAGTTDYFALLSHPNGSDISIYANDTYEPNYRVYKGRKLIKSYNTPRRGR